MSADLWAGYISGAIGILIGNPLDIIKVRLQAGTLNQPTPTPTTINTRITPLRSHLSYASQFSSASTLIRGVSAPILGYGALNALLFMTYNRTSSFLAYGTLIPPSLLQTQTQQPNLWTTFIAGALGGLATWVISTPTELIKCRAQTSTSTSPHSPPSSSWTITKSILRKEGIRGLYFGGVVTALRDSIGYGFYFWSYELSTRLVDSHLKPQNPGSNGNAGSTSSSAEAAKVLLCGGLAGVITWASVFPLDVIKTRVQTQIQTQSQPQPNPPSPTSPLLPSTTNTHTTSTKPKTALQIAKHAYRTEGISVFFRGLGVCSIRAFVVNAAQWAVYEWVMRELDPDRGKEGVVDGAGKIVERFDI